MKPSNTFCACHYKFLNQCPFLEWATNETPLSLNKLLLRLVLCLFVSIPVCIVPHCVWVPTTVGCWACTIDSAWQVIFVAVTTLSAACFPLWFAATVYDINETLGSGKTSVNAGWWNTALHLPTKLISTFGGPCWSASFRIASFDNVLCEHGDNRFASVSGNAMMHIGFPVFPVTCLTHRGS